MRWGKSTYPTELGTQLLYAGRAAGPNYTQQGGGADLLCLADIAEYLSANSPDNNRARLQGVEIQSTVGNLNLRDHNLPCAVCYTPTRSTMVIIPAWTHCPASWTKEYIGYMMTEFKNHRRLQHVYVWTRVLKLCPERLEIPTEFCFIMSMWDVTRDFCAHRTTILMNSPAQCAPNKPLLSCLHRFDFKDNNYIVCLCEISTLIYDCFSDVF